MREPLILKMLDGYASRSATRFHMPGHKGEREYSARFPMAERDVTELSFSGCLSPSSGVISEAEKNIATIFSSQRSFMVTDGSTAAILAMAYVLSKRGRKVIIPRNSHKSVYNALKILNLTPVFLECFYDESGIIKQSDVLLEEALCDGDVAGAIVVSPDYYGNVLDFGKLKSQTEKAGKLLAVDGAHGAHLNFYNRDLYAGNYADIWVDGVHKTLPCLTQAALLHVNEGSLIDDAEDGLGLFRTTSPSYPIMASIEYGVYFAEGVGFGGCDTVRAFAEAIAEEAAEQDYKFVLPKDPFKLLLDTYASFTDGSSLVDFLEKNGVFAEMFDGRYIVFMLSFLTEKRDAEALVSALKEYRAKYGKTPCIAEKQRVSLKLPERKTSYADACASESEYVSLEEAKGRISAENVGFFPPCYPLICAGEVIDGDLAEAIFSEPNSFGLRNGKFKVIK